jgi:hypothetical protein
MTHERCKGTAARMPRHNDRLPRTRLPQQSQRATSVLSLLNEAACYGRTRSDMGTWAAQHRVGVVTNRAMVVLPRVGRPSQSSSDSVVQLNPALGRGRRQQLSPGIAAHGSHLWYTRAELPVGVLGSRQGHFARGPYSWWSVGLRRHLLLPSPSQTAILRLLRSGPTHQARGSVSVSPMAIHITNARRSPPTTCPLAVACASMPVYACVVVANRVGRQSCQRHVPPLGRDAGADC